MTVATALAVGLTGVTGTIVEVEADVGPGLPGMYLGGLGDTAVAEARQRVRTAAVNSALAWPRSKIVVSLSPAHLRKHGTGFDLAIACAILAAAAPSDNAQQRLLSSVLIGELGLDGSIKGVQGVLPAVLVAREAGAARVIVSPSNAAEAALVDGIAVCAAASLSQLWQWVLSGAGIAPVAPPSPAAEEAEVDLREVIGQDAARFALEVAAAGAHHLFLQGSPGTGKSMLARRLPTILPPLEKWQQLEATAVHSVAGTLADGASLLSQPPFVAPHHSATTAALIGGGAIPKPGAISLAHHGVLFLDEVSLMKPAVLDALREPLESGVVTHMRAHHRVAFGCRTQLVMAANPCRCQAAWPQECVCSAPERARHQRALSGPLRDRIDIAVQLTPASASLSAGPVEDSATVRERVAQARSRAAWRWQRCGVEPGSGAANALVARSLLRRESALDEEALALIEYKLRNGEITQRGVDKILALAWTLADLAGSDHFDFDQVQTALDLHDQPDAA